MISDNILKSISLEGKVAVISGAGSGIGLGMARKLAEAGAAIGVLDVNEDSGSAAVRELEALGAKAKFFSCDVRRDADCAAAARGVVDAFGKIDILCNNAGVARRKNVVDLAEADWDLAMDVTLKGVYMLSHHVVPYMIENGGGAIVNTGSGWHVH